MIYLLETEKQYKYLLNSGYTECYLEVIGCYGNTTHPIVNPISCVYIKPILDNNNKSTKGFILPSKHIDSPYFIPKKQITKLLNKFSKIYCRDKKSTLHHFPLKSLLQIPNTQTIDISNNTPPIKQNFEYRLKNQPTNYMIPITKLYEE